MGLGKIGMSLAQKTASWVKAAGKTSVLQTKPITPTQLQGLRLAPNLAFDTVQLSNTSYLSESFVKSLTQIKGKDRVETYSKIKDAILKKMGYTNPKLIKVEAANGFKRLFCPGAAWSEEAASIIIGDIAKNTNIENGIAMMYHEIDHMDKFVKLYKSLGEGKFLKLVSKRNPEVTLNLDVYREMSKNVDTIGFNVGKYSKAYLEYPEQMKGYRDLYKYLNNPLEAEAFTVQSKVQKTLGLSELTTRDAFPKNYKAMLDSLAKQGITDIKQQDLIIQDIVDLCQKKVIDEKAFKLFCKEFKKIKLTESETNYLEELQETLLKGDMNSLCRRYPEAHKEAEELINKGLFSIDDVINYMGF